MIAVIEPKHSAVWGFGKTESEARKHAADCIARWKNKNPGGDIGRLELATLSDQADLRQDGETLWQWVMNDKPVQGALL